MIEAFCVNFNKSEEEVTTAMKSVGHKFFIVISTRQHESYGLMATFMVPAIRNNQPDFSVEEALVDDDYIDYSIRVIIQSIESVNNTTIRLSL